MRLLADENCPRQLVELLRQNGHDVLWASSEFAGAADEIVLSRATADGRILLTFDKDFGELAFRHGLPSICGVILVRFVTGPPGVFSHQIVRVLESRGDWSGVFAVVEPDRVRIRPLTP